MRVGVLAKLGNEDNKRFVRSSVWGGLLHSSHVCVFCITRTKKMCRTEKTFAGIYIPTVKVANFAPPFYQCNFLLVTRRSANFIAREQCCGLKSPRGGIRNILSVWFMLLLNSIKTKI